MTIKSRPNPDGEYFQHTLEGKAEAEPSAQFTDSLNDLERLQAGDAYPMVTATPDSDGSWLISVSLWSENELPSPEEIASLSGTLAEVVASTHL